MLERIVKFSIFQFAASNSWPLSHNSRLRIHFTDEQNLGRLFDISNEGKLVKCRKSVIVTTNSCTEPQEGRQSL